MFEKILIRVARPFLYTITLLMILLISVVVLVYFMEFSGEPSASRYKKRLEAVTDTKLLSCRLIKKDYREDEYYSAIFKLNQKDYDKVFDAVRADTSFLYKPNMEIRNLTLKMLQKRNIDIGLINCGYTNPHYDYLHLYFLEKRRMIIMDGNIIK